MVVARSLPIRSHGRQTRQRRAFVTTVAVTLGLTIAACGSPDDETSTSSIATTIPVVQLTAPAGATTTAAGARTANSSGDTIDPLDTIVVPITIADVSVAPAFSVPVLSPATTATTRATTPAATCPGNTTLPTGVVTGDSIVGNVDGDAADDTVTAYTATDGTAHVFLQRGGANASDVTLDLGGATMVSLSWEDVDYSLGAEVTPPLVILAIGIGAEGSAVATFLSPSRSSGSGHCLAQWTVGTAPFTFAIDQRGPFSGLLCDGAAGHRYYVLRTATPDGAGSVVVMSREIDHDGTVVTITKLGDETIPHDANSQRNFGDIQNCDHAPLFADFPLAPVPETTTSTVTSTAVVTPATGG